MSNLYRVVGSAFDKRLALMAFSSPGRLPYSEGSLAFCPKAPIYNINSDLRRYRLHVYVILANSDSKYVFWLSCQETHTF